MTGAEPESAPASDSLPRPTSRGGGGGGEKGGAAVIVASGILASRVLGLVRESAKNAFLGATGTITGDAFSAAFRIPNALQNLLGEGALSASFIPVYRRLLDSEDREEADRLVGAMVAILSLVVAITVAIGVVAAPFLARVIAPGYSGEKLELTIQLTRIFFPGAGLFVMSALCLGIQNSHRRFLLSYLSPVAWNVAMIVAFVANGRTNDLSLVARTAAWGSVIGAALQFAIQIPLVVRLAGRPKLNLDLARAPVQRVLRGFAPVALSRGVIQASAYIDTMIASGLPRGMVALLSSTQTITMLPVSLFGIAVSAAELPALSSATGSEEEQRLWRRDRLAMSSRQVAFFVIPSAVAFILLGDTLIRALFEYRRFLPADTKWAWAILGMSAVGLLANTLARQYANVFYAIHDTRTPVVFAVARVLVALALGWFFALVAPGVVGIDAHLGAAGLSLAGGIAGWMEFTLLRRGLQRVIGPIPGNGRFLLQLWALGLVAGLLAFGVKIAAGNLHQIVAAILVFGTFGSVYLGFTLLSGFPEAQRVVSRIRRR